MTEADPLSELQNRTDPRGDLEARLTSLRDKVPADYASKILTSVLLPLATLILGHYFGTLQKGS